VVDGFGAAGLIQEEGIALVNNEIATISELSEGELDLVAAGAHANSLVNINLPININIGVGVQNGLNIAVLSLAKQSIGQNLIIGQFNFA
jgi:hypothetical protein